MKRMSLALSEIDRASHSAFQKILNKSSSLQSLKSTTPLSFTSSRFNKFDHDYAKLQKSQFLNHFNIPFNLTANRFEWQTSAVVREVLMKQATNISAKKVQEDKIKKTSINPKHLPLNEEPLTKKFDYEIKKRSTSAVISIKDKKKLPEPKYCPIKKYVRTSKEKPGINNLIKKTPVEFEVYTKKRIIPVVKDELKSKLKQFKSQNCNLSHMKGPAKVVNDLEYTQKESIMRSSASCGNLYEDFNENTPAFRKLAGFNHPLTTKKSGSTLLSSLSSYVEFGPKTGKRMQVETNRNMHLRSSSIKFG